MNGEEIILFHSVYGLRPAVHELAGALRAAGHHVHTPDLFDGEVFTTLEDGLKKRDALGIPALIARAQEAVASLPDRLVYAGFSMGTGPAELLAATRPGARGAILMHGAFDPGAYGIAAWPAGVPVQVHHAAGDAWVDVPDVEALRQAVARSGARAEVHVYERGGHLFQDRGLPDHDETSARLMFERILAFLRSL